MGSLEEVSSVTLVFIKAHGGRTDFGAVWQWQSGSRGRLPAPSSHTTVRTVPYTAVHKGHSGLRATCRKRLTLVSRYIGGFAAYLPGTLGHLSLHVCVSCARRTQRRRLGSLVFGPSPHTFHGYYGLG